MKQPKQKKTMINDLHCKAKLQMKNTKENTDNGTDATKRNMVLKGLYYRGEFEPSQDYRADKYTHKNGLIINDTTEDRDKNMAFLKREWKDWQQGLPLGESKSQNEYPELWRGKFDEYCYSDRLGESLEAHFDNVIDKKESRQNFISIWKKEDEGKDIVPCTIGYNSQIIDDELFVTFIYRSMEMSRNSVNDFWLNRKYIQEILNRDLMITKINVTYFITNAHIYYKPFDR